MKINKSRLQKIINEEIQNILQEQEQYGGYTPGIPRRAPGHTPVHGQNGFGDAGAGPKTRFPSPGDTNGFGGERTEAPQETAQKKLPPRVSGPRRHDPARTADEEAAQAADLARTRSLVGQSQGGGVDVESPEGGAFPTQSSIDYLASLEEHTLNQTIQEEMQKILQEQFGDPGAGPEIRFPTLHRTEGLSIGDEELRFAQIAQYNLDNAIKAYNYWGDRYGKETYESERIRRQEFKNAEAAIHQFRDELKDLGVNPGSVVGQRDPWTWVAEDPRVRQRPATPWWPGVGSGPPVIYDREDVRGQFIQEELQKQLQEQYGGVDKYNEFPIKLEPEEIVTLQGIDRPDEDMRTLFRLAMNGDPESQDLLQLISPKHFGPPGMPFEVKPAKQPPPGGWPQN